MTNPASGFSAAGTGDVAGWFNISSYPTDPSNVGSQANSPTAVPATIPFNFTVGIDGSRVGHINTGGGRSLAQDVNFSFVAGHQYTLDVNVGRRADHDALSLPSTGWKVSLNYADDGTQLAAVTGTTVIGQGGTLFPESINYTATAADVDQEIQIRLSDNNTSGDGVNFDVVELASAVASTDATIVVPTLVTSTGANPLFGPEQMTSNSGMSPAIGDGDTLDSALAATHLFGGTANSSWITNGSSGDYFAPGQPGAVTTPTFIWDLGADVPLTDVLLWNYENNGGNWTNVGNQARLIEFRFNTAGEGTATFDGTATEVILDPVIGNGSVNAAQPFDLDGLTARYVEMTVLDNHIGTPGVTGGGDRVGLGEVRFSVVPEPSSWVLALVAGMGLGIFFGIRRRDTK